MSALIPGYGIAWKPGPENLMIVSVGTGSPKPVKPDWARDRWSISIWKALHALTSLAYDNSQLATSVLQWLGDSPQRWDINAEIGGLAHSLPSGGQPLWTFVRYDAPLEARWMQRHLGRTYQPERLHALAKLDDYKKVPELFEIGQAAGSVLIRPEHFI
ncbi:MAG TPA: hypothetical protein VMU37_06310, partial [Caulobacteraceae bacterium]|nr:hypothetical protein [Caulobacteraceae bacterium]